MTLKQLIDLYNFRDYRTEIETENLRYDTSIIRIYLGETIHKDNYIEFGIYDYSEDEYKEKLYTQFLNKDILKRKVVSIYYDDEIGIFCVELEENNKWIIR